MDHRSRKSFLAFLINSSTCIILFISLLSRLCDARNNFGDLGYTLTSRSVDTDSLLTSYRSEGPPGLPNAPDFRRSRRQAPVGVVTTPGIKTVDEDESHLYYTSRYYPDTSDYYIDLNTEPSYTVIPHGALSRTHLTAAGVDLPFSFFFYGHEVTRVYIATGGFLYLGPVFHELISATQYVAPLMGNFDPSINDTSIIRYGNNGTAFTVEWKDIHIQHLVGAGSFTFQTTLFQDGRIIFAYRNVPVSPTAIGGGNGHKVTVGVSDGFYRYEPTFEGSTVSQRVIYRYHIVSLNKLLVVNRSAFILTPLISCNQLSQSCNSCLATPVDNFECGWCGAISTCSSGFDRNRQDWEDAKCDMEQHTDVKSCPQTSITAGQVVGVLIGIGLLLSIAGLIVWIWYGYTYPMSRSGMFLIEFRHHFKKDSTRDVTNDDRYAVTISGDVDKDEQAPPANGTSRGMPADIGLGDRLPATLPIVSDHTPLPSPSPPPPVDGNKEKGDFEKEAGVVVTIPADSSSVVQA